MLSTFSGYSIQHLIRTFHTYLLTDPPPLILPPPPTPTYLHPVYLLIDGLWFGRRFVLMVYRQSKKLIILHISTAGREVASKIVKDLRYIESLGYQCSGTITDDGTGIVSAVDEVFRFLPHQICLAHRHRSIVSALGKHPRDRQVQALKALADHVWLIESQQALMWWIQQVKEWERINHHMLYEMKWDNTGRMWYTHERVRKALRILKELPSTSFKFLDHPLMPKTTNEIEAQFGHLYHRWITHRGLKADRWKQFLKWFVYFYNQKKLSQKNY